MWRFPIAFGFHPMANKDIVSSIMANLRELHPELPEQARVNLELDLRRMESARPAGRSRFSIRASTWDAPPAATATRRPPTPRTDVSPRSEREPLGFADLGEGFN